MKRYALALDLVEEPNLIAEYKKYHEQIPPDIAVSIKESGILNMELYLLGNRLFMIMETKDDFSFEKKAAMDLANSEVQKWEQLMWKYQKALPMAKPGEKWILMEQIFKLPD
jgi:L-rhamnose mutarotase